MRIRRCRRPECRAYHPTDAAGPDRPAAPTAPETSTDMPKTRLKPEQLRSHRWYGVQDLRAFGH